MRLHRHSLAALAVIVLSCLYSFPLRASGDDNRTWQKSLDSLMAGNRRWLAGSLLHMTPPKLIELRRKTGDTGFHQAPIAVIVMCSDTRATPEYIFDQPIGNLFVVRTAGNVVDSIALGSIEYGISVLGAPLVVVVGHSSCGAVKATIEAMKTGKYPDNHIRAIVDDIKPAVIRAQQSSPPPDSLLPRAIVFNAQIVGGIIHSDRGHFGPIADRVKVKSAYLDLPSGRLLQWKDN